MVYLFSDELKARVKANKNALVAVCAVPGEGKSYFALAAAEATDPNMSIDRVCFSLEEFLQQVKSRPPPGSCFILDEGAVTANSRLWYSLQNRLLNYLLVTFRSSNYIVFFCLPNLKSMDSQATKLLHYVLVPTSINRTTNQSTVNLYRLEANPVIGKVYSKHPWARDETGAVTQVMRLKCPLPSLQLRKAYEKKKDEFRKSLESSIEEELAASKVKSEHSKTPDITDAVATIMEDSSAFLRTYAGRTYVSLEAVKNRFNVGESVGKKIKSQVEAKLNEKAAKE